MFCLRSWIPLLFFLSTNASPLYLILFVSATYFLNRPCVYCSLLLAILILSLFDFRNPWFEQQQPPATAAYDPATHPPPSLPVDPTTTGLLCTRSAIASLFESAVSCLAGPVAETVWKVTAAPAAASTSTSTYTPGSAVVETASVGMRILTGKRAEWRIPCLGVVVRL